MKRPDATANRTKAFTLIELLVVVTIIVVLLALLAPAMDKAVYRAELAVCAARLKAHATSATVYAIDHKRHYLDRAAMRGASFRPDYLALTTNTSAANDDRIVLRKYIPINKMFNCPFVAEIDYDGFPPANNPLDAILLYTSVNYWYGWRFKGVAGLKGMRRIGDRVQWKDADGLHDFNVLVADIESEDIQDNWTNSAHPDRDSFLALTTNRNYAHPYVQGYASFSYWGRWGVFPNRGKIDQSFAYEDGSVQTMDDVVRDDNRLVVVPGYMSAANTLKCRTWLPKQ